MSKSKTAATPEPIPIRAVDPDVVLTGNADGVEYGYHQPTGAYPAGSPKAYADMMLDECLVWVKGIEGIDELRKKGKAWSAIIPPRFATQMYVTLVTAYRLTETEAEG